MPDNDAVNTAVCDESGGRESLIGTHESFSARPVGGTTRHALDLSPILLDCSLPDRPQTGSIPSDLLLFSTSSSADAENGKLRPGERTGNKRLRLLEEHE